MIKIILVNRFLHNRKMQIFHLSILPEIKQIIFKKILCFVKHSKIIDDN